ncbi:D-glycerate dehydrogenase [Methylococcus sp. EFPC2]|uniref:2-hydroxyacid dehydrogenase n=1 Tax=Methylococcus sp. EFPC2 TaxID=2812648 RepID=UPI00196804D8|nr:D-glycerate dehydrogenase [Methylococcus sp. EFPC2]QSA97512.1 D-glycerate dehydrogenase [Methylococcus sp. EFPC2]
MSKPKVIVTRRWPAAVEARLRELFDVTLNEADVPLSADQLKDALRHHDAVLPTVTDALTAEVLGAEPLRARMLGNFGVGYNHIDIEAAMARGITVTNTPDVLTDCTADIAVTLMLMVARRAGEGEREVRSGHWAGWRPTHLIGTKVTGKTLGLIGFGRIARALAKKAHYGFDMPVIFYTPHPPEDEVCRDLGAKPCASIEEVLKQADFVSLHCPGSKENRHLIDAERLALMKPGAFLINTARGDVVDNDALVRALKNKTIAGAGLDVYEGEPHVNPGFLELENVVLLPHMGSSTEETRAAMGLRVVENLSAYFAGQVPRDKVV